MDKNFKDKYLKYKAKYLELKNQKGGQLSEDEKLDLKIDMCVSYVMQMMGNVQNVISAIIENINLIKDNLTNGNYNDNQRSLVELLLQNEHMLKQIQIVDLTPNNDGNKGLFYSDLFDFSHMDQAGNYIILKESKRGNSYEIKSKILTFDYLQTYKNSLVNLAANEGVHWIYIDENSQIHNPYNYNMQVNHSHQFCQTHSLLMALIPATRTICTIYNDVNLSAFENDKLERRCAYENILVLLSIIFHLVIFRSFSLKQIRKTKKQKSIAIQINTTMHTEILEEADGIRALNINEMIENQKGQDGIDFVNQFIDNYIKLPNNQGNIKNFEELSLAVSANILAILNTDRAREIAPEFK